LAVTSRGNVATESSLVFEHLTMDLVGRVQKELKSEEKCIKISFSSYFISNLVLLQRLQLRNNSIAWDCYVRETALVFKVIFVILCEENSITSQNSVY